MSKSKFSLRQIIGDAFLVIAGALILGLLALPFLMAKGVDVGGVISTLAFACIVILLGIIDMIGAFAGKKFLNVTFFSRIVSVLLVAFAIVAFISIVAYVAQSGIEITETSGFDIYRIGTGYIMALVFSVVALLASFVAKTKKAKK